MNVTQLEVSPNTAAPETPSNPELKWRPFTRVACRFAFAYLILYNFPFPLGALPHTEYVGDKYAAIWHAVVPWVGRHLLHLNHAITVFTNGSGDTTFDYVLVLCYLVLSAAVALVWSIIDRERPAHPSLHKWLRFYVRITLGGTMISYGAYKVIQSQFPAPSLAHLLEPYGEASPMGLLWTWMGASHPYNVFAGLCEMCGGILLFLPRVTTLGALILIGVLSNVFILNMSYDVPVKLYSFHLLLMGVFLIAPDLRRLIVFLVLERPVEAAAEPSLFQRQALNRGALALLWILGALFVGTSLYQSRQQALQYGTHAPKSPLYGIWSVDEFALDGAVRPPLLTDELRWQRVIFEYPEVLNVQAMNGARQPFSLKLDTVKRSLSMGKFDDKNWKAEFAIVQPEPNRIVLDGRMDGKLVQIKLQRTDPKFLLTTRGFHWVNEYPLNR
jgi:hypothetical protein